MTPCVRPGVHADRAAGSDETAARRRQSAVPWLGTRVVGRIAARAFAAEATVLAAARSLDRTLAQVGVVPAEGCTATAGHAALQAEIDVEQAQVPELALAAAQQLIEASGASAG